MPLFALQVKFKIAYFDSEYKPNQKCINNHPTKDFAPSFV
jgi:hypothetical protein